MKLERSIQKLIQEKVELNVKMNELKSSLDEVMYSLTLKDEQLAKLENTQKSLQSLTEENNKLKNRLLMIEVIFVCPRVSLTVHL